MIEMTTTGFLCSRHFSYPFFDIPYPGFERLNEWKEYFNLQGNFCIL